MEEEQKKLCLKPIDQETFARSQLTQISQQITELKKREQFFKSQLERSHCSEQVPLREAKDFFTESEQID